MKILKHYTIGLMRKLDEHHALLLAAGIAYSILVCLIPLVLIVSSILGSILEHTSITEDIMLFIDRAIPYEESANFVKNIVDSRATEFKIYKGFAGVIGILFLFLTASALFSGMRTVVNRVYHTESKEPFYIGKLRDFGLVLVIILYFLLSTAVLPGWEVLKSSAENIEFLNRLRFGILGSALLNLVTFALIFVAFFIVYFTLPYKRVPKSTVLISAISAAVLWKLAEQLFGFYLTTFGTLKNVYGAYAMIVAAAFWIYYISLVFIVGAEIGQLFREHRCSKDSEAE